MRMASEFLYVAGAGLAVLIVGGVLAGFVAEAPQDGAAAGEPIFSEDLGTVGEINSSDRRIEFDPVTVVEQSPNATVLERSSVRASANVMGASSEVVEFEARSPQRSYISFVPAESSAPSDLVIEVNGEELSVPDYTAGERVTIPTDGVQDGDNVLRVAARSPGLAVWRSPSYDLQNFRVVVTSEANARVVMPFRAYGYEIDGFDRGELQFSTGDPANIDASEALKVAINGNTIMERNAIDRIAPYRTQFSQTATDLHAGENTISFFTEGTASYELEDIRMWLYFYAGARRRTVVRSFNLTGDEYGRLGSDNGRINVFVQSATHRRPVTVQLPDQQFTRTLGSGQNTFTFGQDAVEPGQNQFQISTDGSYVISNFTVGIADGQD